MDSTSDVTPVNRGKNYGGPVEFVALQFEPFMPYRLGTYKPAPDDPIDEKAFESLAPMVVALQKTVSEKLLICYSTLYKAGLILIKQGSTP